MTGDHWRDLAAGLRLAAVICREEQSVHGNLVRAEHRMEQRARLFEAKADAVPPLDDLRAVTPRDGSRRGL